MTPLPATCSRNSLRSTRDLRDASDVVAEELDETQFTLGEGPCLEAFRFDSPELHADMADGVARARWPLFAAQVLGLGAASVYAYPLGGGGAPVGCSVRLVRRKTCPASTNSCPTTPRNEPKSVHCTKRPHCRLFPTQSSTETSSPAKTRDLQKKQQKRLRTSSSCRLRASDVQVEKVSRHHGPAVEGDVRVFRQAIGGTLLVFSPSSAWLMNRADAVVAGS